MSIYNEHNLSRKKLRKECVFASLVNEAPKKQRNKEEADGEKKPENKTTKNENSSSLYQTKPKIQNQSECVKQKQQRGNERKSYPGSN